MCTFFMYHFLCSMCDVNSIARIRICILICQFCACIWKNDPNVPVRKVFHGILHTIRIIWIQLCHYSRLLSVCEGLLNTPVIRLQYELLFSQSISPLDSLHCQRNHTRSLLRFLPLVQPGPHLAFDLALWLAQQWWLNTDTHEHLP